MNVNLNPPRTMVGSNGGSTPTSTADNLFSTDTVEILFGVSEGPIKGLVDGAKSFYVGDTTLMNVDGTNNFEEFELIARNGSELGVDIASRMGGFGSATDVNTNLSYNVPVVRSGLMTSIDYIDVRLLINNLQITNSKGTFDNTGKVKIEFKRSDQAIWTPVTAPEVITIPSSVVVTDGVAYYSSNTNASLVLPAKYDRKAVSAALPPAVAPYNIVGYDVLWFESDVGYAPRTIVVGAWLAIAGATLTAAVGPNLPYWTFTITAFGKTTTYKAHYGILPPLVKALGDFWINTSNLVVKYFNGEGWMFAGESFNLPNNSNSSTIVNGEVVITGKTSTTMVKEIRIPVTRNASFSYDLRLTRTSPANTTEVFFDVSWESFSEITGQVFNFPGLATTQLTARASDQFSSVPEFSGVYDGRVVRVPTNYNPVTRVYTGVWGGTWKFEYTNNPAFIGYDLVSNTRYGMNAYYPVTLQPDDVYAAGVWADTLTADGTPRFTFNALMAQGMNGREAINYVFGVIAGRFFDDGNGFGVIRIDTDSPAVQIFTPENVEKGVFSYAQTPMSGRYNDVTVSFINPDLNWQEDRRRVIDQVNIDTFGRNAMSMTAVGCTNVTEAVRRGRYQLITGLTEKTMVSFTTNRMGTFLQPYDVILVADVDMDFGMSGRILTISGAQTFTLRDALFLEVGVPYAVSFTTVNVVTGEFTVITMNVHSSQTGSRTSIQLTTTLPAEITVDTIFSLHTQDTTSTPKPFRVMNIEVSDDNADMVKITGTEINRLKWTYIDGFVTGIVSNTNYNLSSSKLPEPVPQAEVRVDNVTMGSRIIRNYVFNWEPSPSTFVVRYRLSGSLNGGPMLLIGEAPGLTYTWSDVAPGDYVFMIQPVGANGLIGQKSYFQFNSLQTDTDINPLSGLVATNAGVMNTDGSYIHRIEVSWTPVTDYPITHYVVQWKKAADTKWQSTSVVDAIHVINNVTFGVNYNIRVKAQADAKLVRSFSTVSLVVTGDVTAPAVPTNWIGTVGFDTISLSGDRNTEVDFFAYKIYGATAASATLTLLAQVSANSYTRRPPGGDPYTRYKISAIDFTGNESATTAFVNVVPTIDLTTTVPSVPTGLALTSSLLADQKAQLQATWNATTDTNLAYYEVRIRQGAGSDVVFQTSSNIYKWDVQPGVLYNVSVRAVNRLGVFSVYCTNVAHTALLDTVAPAVPTTLTALAGFGVIWLNWTPSIATDFASYHVYESATNTAPLAGTSPTFVTAAAVMSRSGLGDAVLRYYWVRAVDTSGNKSAWSSVASATTVAVSSFVTSGALAGLVDASSFAAGIEPVTIIPGAVLPTVKTTETIFFQSKLYRWNGTAYTKAVDAVDIVANSITAGQISAGAISADQLAANSVVATKLLIGDTSNIFPDPLMVDRAAFTSATTYGTTWDIVTNTIPGSGSSTNLLRIISAQVQAYSLPFSVQEGQQYFVSAYLQAVGAGVGTPVLRIHWYSDFAGTVEVQNDLIGTTTSGAFVLISNSFPTPPGLGVRCAKLRFSQETASPTRVVRFATPTVRLMNQGEMIVDGAISATKLVTGSAVITGTAQIANAIITDAHITTLNATKLIAGSALAGSITVNSKALSTIESNSSDPAAVVNLGTTKIDPGKIVISGGTTLSDWRMGSDLTKIDGGAISANTITANKLTIGQRNVTVTGVIFEYNDPLANSVSWTTGSVKYIDDTGTAVNVTVTASNAAWTSGILYLYWVKGATTLSTSNVIATAFGANNLILATYAGGLKLITDYGQTIIDGSNIKTGSIVAAQLTTTTAVITTSAQIANLTVDTLNIKDNAVTIAASVTRTEIIPITSSSVYTKVAQLSISRAAMRTLLTVSVTMDGYGESVGSFALMRGPVGSEVKFWEVAHSLAPGGRQATMTFIAEDMNTATGSTRYSLWVKKVIPGNTGGWDDTFRLLKIIVKVEQTKK